MGNIDLVLILLYVLCFIRVKSAASFVALFLFAVSINLVSYDYSFVTDKNYDYIVISFIYMSLCLTKDRCINIAAASIVIFQYIMAWDYYINPRTETWLFSAYPFASFMLNLALILTINRGLKDGFYNADNCWYNDLKFNEAHNKVVQRRQRT